MSDNSFTEGLIINGPIRDEIKLNYGLGAMGPFSQANSTIGRAWNLLSINAGNCGRVGTTYMGTVGNPMNWNNVIIAENEKDSPWQPYHVRKGFKPSDSVVTLCEGWGVLSAKNSKYSVWQKEMDFPGIVKKIVNDQDGLFGALVVLNPTVANYIKEAGYDTVEKFTQYLLAPAEGQATPEAGSPNRRKGPGFGASAGKHRCDGRIEQQLLELWRNGVPSERPDR